MKTEFIKTAVKPTGAQKPHANIAALLRFFSTCKSLQNHITFSHLKNGGISGVPLLIFGDNWRN
jgi:hypothetical protein